MYESLSSIEQITPMWLTDLLRKQVFFTKVLGPTDEEYSDPDAVQDTFVQQRGFKDNELGPTGDVRSLREKGVLTDPITGPKQVSEKGDPQDVGSAFYDE